MTYLRSVPSDLGHEAFQRRRYGALVPLPHPAAARRRTQGVSIVLFAALGLVVTLLHYWRRAVETRRARHHLMQLDDHLLRDIGFSRTEVRFDNFAALAERPKSQRI
jgi:uncharacterized protein YjiS (DUF1127 family)